MLEKLPHLEALQKLRRAFLRHDRDIRVVGGCVRDLMLGKAPSDVDLCTNATPDEQRHIYEAEGIRHVDTGLHHGTWTVVVYDDADEQIVLEITSLRIDTDQDGRHATVVYTHDWLLDLSRRDLTINAMELTLDGELVDPFNGAQDLADGRVVFVGNAEERIREDYLRILRWFRFSARYCKDGIDEQTQKVVTLAADGLKQISRERVWLEISKIVSGPRGPMMIYYLLLLRIYHYIDLPVGSVTRLDKDYNSTKNPVFLMTAFVEYDENRILELARKWKWSNEEKRMAKIRCAAFNIDSLAEAKKLVAMGADKDLLVEALRADDAAIASELEDWPTPVLPVAGVDIVSAGVPPGPRVGMLHRVMRDRWIESDYTLTKEELLAMISEEENV